MQTADLVQNADSEERLFFRHIRNNMSFYNLPSVMQSLFCSHCSEYLISLWVCTFFRSHMRFFFWLRNTMLILASLLRCGGF